MKRKIAAAVLIIGSVLGLSAVTAGAASADTGTQTPATWYHG